MDGQIKNWKLPADVEGYAPFLNTSCSTLTSKFKQNKSQKATKSPLCRTCRRCDRPVMDRVRKKLIYRGAPTYLSVCHDFRKRVVCHPSMLPLDRLLLSNLWQCRLALKINNLAGLNKNEKITYLYPVPGKSNSENKDSVCPYWNITKIDKFIDLSIYG